MKASINQIKRNRTPESPLIEMVQAMQIIEQRNPNKIYYEYNDVLIIEYQPDYNEIYVDYYNIRKVLNLKYSDNELESFLKNVIAEYTEIVAHHIIARALVSKVLLF